jgi:endonuclease YncB( thermonuclease family)
MLSYGPYRGVVDQVHDGDTIYIKLDLGFDLTVYARCRIFGINAPELSTDPGKVARDFARTLLPIGKAVLVTSHGWDKYGGRVDASVEFDGKDFGDAMVVAGQAVRI